MKPRNTVSTRRLSTGFVARFLLSLLVIAPVMAPGPAAGQLPIPQLALWEANMVSYGQTHCNALATPNISLLDQVYYDAQRVFLQIADFTGNAAWTTCAQRGAAIYRDLYVLPNNGMVPGYWNFTTGLRMDAQRTGSAASQTAVMLLSTNMWAADSEPLSWTVSADLSREVAYAILSYINAQALGQAPRQRRIDLVNQAYGHMNQWFVNFSWPGPWQLSPQTTIRLAPFMVALTSHALIRDWEQTGDARAIPALKLAADWMWAHAWIPTGQAMWYEFPDQGQPCCQASAPAPDLNLLIAPIYAFLYWQTGDTKYRDEGDQLFAGGAQLAWLGGGKQFDQNYWWSFDYVQWRTGPATPNPLPSVSSLAPNNAAAGAAGFLLTVSGTNFVPTSGVQWNGTNRTTTFVSSTQLQATILASDITVAGTAQVTVLNPSPGGGTSNALTFTIAPPVAVSVVRAGSGSGTVTSAPSGISCGSNCSAAFPSGTSVVLTATPDASSSFGSWSGCDSVAGTQCTVVVTATRTVTATFQATTDTTPPTVSMTAPLAAATVAGTISVSANATDNVGVVGVQFKLDGANLGAEVTAAPYTVSWNTASATEGSHVLTAVARDAAGNLGTSAQVSVTVANSSTNPNTTVNPTAGLVAYWKFDDGTGATAMDSSGYGNTGTLVNGPVWTTGKFGQALAFDGLTNYVDVPSTPTLNAYPLTVAFWMKTSTTTGTAGIVNKYVAGSFNGYQVFMYAGNLCAWYLRDGSNYVFDGSLCSLSTAGYNDNQWHQVVFVVDASGGRLYVDGLQKASLGWTGTPGATTTTQDLSFGYYPAVSSGGFFPGVLDEVRIYNSALSSADVSTIYTLNPPVISGITASNVSSSGATITWTTNVASDSQVDYGLTTAYGSSTPLNASLVTSHPQTLSLLAPRTTYHYRVKSKDAAGNLATSGDKTFTTAAAPPVHNKKKSSSSFFDQVTNFFKHLF